jgi:signal transduction histidine kinase
MALFASVRLDADERKPDGLTWSGNRQSRSISGADPYLLKLGFQGLSRLHTDDIDDDAPCHIRGSELATPTSYLYDAAISQTGESAQSLSLTAQATDAVAQERLRIARDLHDHVGQQFVGIKMRLAALELHATDHAQRHLLRELQDTITRVSDEVSAICAGERCGVPGGGSLVSALEDLILRWAHEVGITARFRRQLRNCRKLDDATAEAVFHIVQEALTNVAKHAAQASLVKVHLWLEAQMLKLEIEDDGLTAPAKPTPPRRGVRAHCGIVGMRERVTELGGQFAVRHLRGKGTRVMATFPMGEPRTGRAGAEIR